MSYYQYIPFAPSNYDGLDTQNNELFYVRSPIEGAQELILYQNRADGHRVNKSLFLTEVGKIYGVYRESISYTNMAIVIEYGKAIDFNYVYIPTLKRYYFVSQVTILNNNLCEISLSIDVLMTYRQGIYKLHAFVDRNEKTYNEDIIDNKRVVIQGQDIEVGDTTNLLLSTDPAYVLTTFACKLKSEGGVPNA